MTGTSIHTSNTVPDLSQSHLWFDDYLTTLPASESALLQAALQLT